MNDVTKKLVRVKGGCVYSIVCMIVLVCRGEEVDDGNRSGFYQFECAEVSSYVDLYEDVDVCEDHEEGFCVVCSLACVRGQRKTWFFCIH